jgi:glycosyltransferase involved in cell wall biosynthesis
MRIKVLHICISDARGGAAIAAGRLNQLMNEDNRLSSKMLVLIKNSRDISVSQLSIFSMQKARVANFLNNKLGAFKKMYGLFSFGLFGNQLNRNYLVQEADVIYIHWVSNGMMSWNSIEQVISIGKPIFLFGHDMWYFTGGCHYSSGCLQFKSECKKCPYFESKILQDIVSNSFINKKICYTKYFKVTQILPSNDFYQKALNSGIIEESRLNFIPNILNTSLYKPKVNNRSDNRIRILFGAIGGQTNPYKGWDDFVYFATEINEYYKDLIVFGLFGYNFRDDEINAMSFKFHNYGLIDNDTKMVEMYQNNDVFIFPSNQESFGQTLFEAMSCGVIPIAYNVGIAPDIIEDSTNGFLVNIRDRDGLVTAFDALVASDIESLKRAARDSIITNFSKEIILNKHIALMQSLLL